MNIETVILYVAWSDCFIPSLIRWEDQWQRSGLLMPVVFCRLNSVSA